MKFVFTLLQFGTEQEDPNVTVQDAQLVRERLREVAKELNRDPLGVHVRLSEEMTVAHVKTWTVRSGEKYDKL